MAVLADQSIEPGLGIDPARVPACKNGRAAIDAVRPSLLQCGSRCLSTSTSPTQAVPACPSWHVPALSMTSCRRSTISNLLWPAKQQCRLRSVLSAMLPVWHRHTQRRSPTLKTSCSCPSGDASANSCPNLRQPCYGACLLSALSMLLAPSLPTAYCNLYVACVHDAVVAVT